MYGLRATFTIFSRVRVAVVAVIAVVYFSCGATAGAQGHPTPDRETHGASGQRPAALPRHLVLERVYFLR